MRLKTGQAGLDMIKQYEGCRLMAYKCPAGVLTIGYGHTAGVKAGQTITQAQADKYLVDDVAKYEKNVNKYYEKYRWNQNEFDALVSFAFNIGSIDQLTAGGTRTRAQIADKITAYCKAGGKVLAGLVRRREAERKLFLAATGAVQSAEQTSYTAGKTYTLQNNMYVRISASGEKKPYDSLTVDAKKNAKKDAEGYGILNKGTRVTCKEVEKVNGATWVRIPSGWICGLGESGKVYLE